MVGNSGDPQPRKADEPYIWPEGFMYKEPTITSWYASRLAWKYPVLTLLHVKELKASVAKSLVTHYEDTFLTFPELEKLDAPAANNLSRRRGHLRLWGLKSLTPEIAAGLGSHKGQTLDLSGVKELSPDVAKALAGGKRSALWLGLTSLPVELAIILAEFQGDLAFEIEGPLSVEAAAALRRHCGRLDLGKAKISIDAAEVLLGHEGAIGALGVARLEPGVGDILARHSDEVLLMLEEIDSVALAKKLFSGGYHAQSVSNLRTISPQIAAEVAQLDPGCLERLESLSPEAAAELAKNFYGITLPAISRLTPELARALTDGEPPVYLSGIKSLEGPEALAVAEVLASAPAPVYLEFLERVSPEVLAVLRKKPTITLPPATELTIVP